MAVGDIVISPTRDGKWMVRHDGSSLVTFPEKRHAIRVAVFLANATGSKSQKATVTGMDSSGSAYRIWTYGVDLVTTVR